MKFYFPALDGLRLLASINIVLLHLRSSNALVYAENWTWLSPVIQAPAFAAGVFFVLAGFLFASKFTDPKRKVLWRPFMLSRLSKLYRLHFAMTLLMFLVLAFKLSSLNGFPSSLNSLFNAFAEGYGKMQNPIRSLFLHFSLLWSVFPKLGMKLNEASWALSSFFLCYALTPWLSQALLKLQQKQIWILLFLVFIPGVLWGILFGNLGNTPTFFFESYSEKYRFFHMFSPVRLFEYVFGMLLFRLYQCGAFEFLKQKYYAQIFEALAIAALYISLFFLNTPSTSWNYINHHSLPIFLYGMLILSLTTKRTVLCYLFSIGPIRAVGRASFYPYLIHLPLISIAWSLGNLNTPKATLYFLIFTYGISTLYLQFKIWKKRKLKKSF